MNVLQITQEPPLEHDEVVSGNAVRSQQLRKALETAGHTVSPAWLGRGRRPRGGKSGHTFRNRDELQGLLMQSRPEVILVAYWELLGLLPAELDALVVLDYVAPRSLEELFESPESVRASMRRLKLNLRRCDLILVGNQEQKHLLVNLLLESGFDLRDNDPVRVVPLGAEIAGPPESDPDRDGWVFVSGGVTWPWRHAEPFLEKLESALADHAGTARLVRFGGGYRWHGPESERSARAAAERPLESYRNFSEFLSSNAHIGVELAAWNIERQYSQSFRSLEFLRHGLPLLCNRYLPLARLVETYDAGWLVDGPESLAPLLHDILARPEAWRLKSANARKLVSEALQAEQTTRPLLEWLEKPAPARRLPGEIPARDVPPVLGVPPLTERLKRQAGLVRKVALGRLFGQVGGRNVLFVTRGDLFPPDHGAAVRTVETARALSRSGIDVGIVTDDRRHWYRCREDGVEKVRYPAWTRLLGLPAPLMKLLHFSKDLPFSNSFLYQPLTDRSFFWRTLAAARRIRPGVLQAEFPAYAEPCIRARDTLNCSVVLVEHNVEYDRLKAQVPELTDAQYRNLKEIEIDLCNRSDAVVCVSDNDRQKLGEDGVAPDLLHTVPHGVDLAAFDSAPAVNVRQQFSIPADDLLLVYHGTFSYPPNQEALHIFADILLPGLEDRGLACHLLAIGRDPPPATPHPRIHLTGSVEHVAPLLRAADLSVVPLIDGGGTRMKIIDCFAARLAVISTSKGIEGIPVTHGEQALVLDDWDAVIDAVCDLWANPERARALAAAGRALAEKLDWSAIARQYRELYAALG